MVRIRVLNKGLAANTTISTKWVCGTKTVQGVVCGRAQEDGSADATVAPTVSEAGRTA